MLDRDIRLLKDDLLEPVIKQLAPVHPTAIAVVGFGVGMAAGVFAWQGAALAGITCWVLNRLSDGLDGGVARYTNRANDLGSHIDVLMDGVVNTFILAMFAIGQGTTAAYAAGLFVLFALRVNTTSWAHLSSILEKRGLGAKANGEQTSVTLPSGLIEGSEIFLFICAMYLLPAWVVPLMWALGALLLVTVGQRFVWAAYAL
jgi:phosphatidylglycerophosphate synthase